MSNKYESLELKASYGIGLNMGGQLLGQSFEGLDIEAVATGLRDSFNRAQLAVPHAEIEVAFQHITQVMQAKQAEQAQEVIREGEIFLKQNADKEGVTITESGLQYEVITEGAGEKPTATSKVRTHYHGMLTDGTVFDSSVQRGQPAEFAVNGVIKGWTEALQLMNTGSKWRLTIPYELAYGEHGAGAAIGPFATLVFEVELLEIVG